MTPAPAVVISDPDSPPRESWLTINEACAAAKVSRRTIYNWLRDGKVRVARTAGGAIRIDPGSLFVSVELK